LGGVGVFFLAMLAFGSQLPPLGHVALYRQPNRSNHFARFGMTGNPVFQTTTDNSVPIKIPAAFADRWTTEEDFQAISAAVAGCQLHDRAMQRQLYDLCHEKAYRLCARMVGRQDAADVCQEAFLKVFQSIEHFAGRSSFTTWMYRIVVNECLQYRRKRATRPTLQLAEFEPTDHKRPEIERAQQRELLEKALEQIDPELRCVFLLREVDELSYSQISEVMQLPEGTVASRLSRAREQLQGILTALGT
jgi:RNA polymerase sigma-70 factor (ECF subfamily)